MQVEEENRLGRLEPGQLWKLEHGYVYIVQLGPRLIHYRVLRQADQKVAVTRMVGTESLLNYLRQNRAALVG